MRNLVSNAIKFTRENGNISLNTEQKDHHTVFTLTDDGVGIPNDKLPFLFDPAKSVSSNGTHNEVGSGLGLALCKNFVERHHGTIYAESQEGKGTAITFSLPNDYGFAC
jgi:signal transduction histidine kinase